MHDQRLYCIRRQRLSDRPELSPLKKNPNRKTVVFITTATAIYSLGHGLHTFTAVPRSTQPSWDGISAVYHNVDVGDEIGMYKSFAWKQT